MKLRPYQEEFVDAVTHAFSEGSKRIMGVAATGAGKTILASELMRREKGNCLFLADAQELVRQNADKFHNHTGELAGVEMGSEHSVPGLDRVVIGTSQSISRRLDKYEEDHFNLIIVDECHRNTLGQQAMRILEHFSYAKVLGVTATPFRSDRKQLGDFYERVAVEIGLNRLVKEGYLSRIRIKSVPMPVDLSAVSAASGRGDYKVEDLGEVIEPILKEAAKQLIEQSEGARKMVVFLPLIKTSIRMSEILNEMGVRAVHVSGEDKSAMEEFTHGDARVICNAQLLTTGWDCPEVDCILVLRPTKSLALYCLDEETEILTKNGFIGVNEFSKNPAQDVAVFDEIDGSISWERNTGFIHREVRPDEHWLKLKGQSSDIRVTNNHTLLYDHKRRTGWKRRKADEVASLKDGTYLPVAGNMSFPGVPLSDDELRFIGWVMTDGSISRHNSAIRIFQGEHQPWCDEIERVIKACGFKFGKSTAYRGNTKFNENSRCVTWTISKGRPRGRDKHLRGWGNLEKWISKDMSELLSEMTREQFATMLHAIHLGDGSKQEGQNWTRRSYHISTGNKVFANRLQTMAILRGWRSSISEGDWNENPIYMVHLKDQDFIKVGSRHGNHAAWKRENPSGRCWCVETPTGTIVTRRRGKVAIMGNCQMVGRGTRTAPGKDGLLLLDPLYLSDDHKLITPARLVARNEDEAQAMRKHIEEHGGGDLLDMEVDVEKQRAEALQAKVDANRKRKPRSVDALEFAMSTGGLEVAEFEPEFGWEAEKPSPKQLEVLERSGFDVLSITSRGQASKLLDLLFVRRERGLATPKQLRMLKRYGHPSPETVTFDDASAWIDQKIAGFKGIATKGRGSSLSTKTLVELRRAGLRPKNFSSEEEAKKAIKSSSYSLKRK